MSSFKKLLAGAFALALTTAAFAAEPSTTATIVRLTGSTAFRSATHSAIVALFDAAPVAGYSGSSLSGSSQSFFYGQISGQPVIIETSWSGSTGGNQTVSQGIAINFLPDTLADSTSTPVLAAAGGSVGNATGGTSLSSQAPNLQIPDVGMSDSYQAATPFNSPVNADQLVGVVGFKWVANRGTSVTTLQATTTAGSAVVALASTSGLSAGMTVSSTSLPAATLLKILSVDSGTQVTLTSGTGVLVGTNVNTTFVTPCPISNISPQSAQALYSNGTAKLALFTGNPADTQLVYACGRDPDSGTRLTAFAETGIGVTSTVTQYLPVIASGAITSIAPYGPQTVNGILFTTGNGGESSGSSLRNFFLATSAALNSGAGGYIIGYLSTGDAPTAINGGGKELSYNGVFYSIQDVQEGRYTFWTYEHLMYPLRLANATPNSTDAKRKAVADALALRIRNVDSPILLSSMHVSRSSDGGVVYHN